MSDMTYFGVVPFERDEEGEMLPGKPREARSEIAARCLAAAMPQRNPALSPSRIPATPPRMGSAVPSFLPASATCRTRCASSKTPDRALRGPAVRPLPANQPSQPSAAHETGTSPAGLFGSPA
jgi:hypothetical protein